MTEGPPPEKKAQLAPLDEATEEKFKLARMAAEDRGWRLLPVVADKVRGDVICQSIAVTAGMLHAFFAAFLDFAKAGVKMPDEQKQKEMDAITKEAMDAYVNAFTYSIQYAEALQAMAMFPMCMSNLCALLEIEAEDGGDKLSAEDIEESASITRVTAALKVLATGADEQVNRAFSILNKAMDMQARGAVWEAQVIEERKAKGKVDDALKAKEDIEYGVALRVAEAKIEAFGIQMQELEQRKKEIKEQIAARDAEREKQFLAMRADFESNKMDAEARRKRAEANWEDQHNRDLSSLQSAIKRQEIIVNEGGYKSKKLVSRMQGWWIFAHSVVKEEDNYSLEPAVKVLTDLRKQKSDLDGQKNPYLGHGAAEQFKCLPKREDFFVKTWLEEEVQGFQSKQDDVSGKLAEARKDLEHERSRLQAADEAWREATQCWTSRRTELETALATDQEAYSMRIIAAYQAGLDMATAASSMAWVQKVSGTSMSTGFNSLASLVKTIPRGANAASQFQRAKRLRDHVGSSMDDCRDELICIHWLKAVAGKFLPLPAPVSSSDSAMQAKRLMQQALEAETRELMEAPQDGKEGILEVD